MDPRTGLVKSGCVEEGLISAASNEMARYYGLPSETVGLETGRSELNFQSSYETGLSALLSMLSFPDIMVGAGVIGGGMVLSLEKLLIDTEIFKMCRRAHQGIASSKDKWMFDVLEQIKPGAQFIDHPTTLKAVRSDELHISRLEAFGGLDTWRHSDKTDTVDMARAKVDQILSSYQPLPLGDEVEKELQKIRKRAI